MKAIPFMALVKQYALARGLDFFTWADMVIAKNLYIEHARINN
ncbi:MAG: hypothetical protein ACJ749_06830 [Flavisolibacter sp.]|jgi:hypothetical protein